MPHSILKKLAGGDRRSIGRSNEVVREVLARPALVRGLIEGLTNDDPIVCMRAADALEKITAQRPDLLRPHKRAILEIAARSSQQEVRWHVAVLFSRMNLRAKERAVAVDILFDYLRDKSSIVKTFAMQGLADLAKQDGLLKSRILPLLKELTNSGTPAMRARGRKLLAGLAE
jgi:HEAT repeat protein